MKGLLFFFTVSIIFLSCKKDKDENTGNLPAQVQLTSYPMTIGNKWKYYTETHLTDTNGNSILDHYYDNFWQVISDTIINGIACSKILQVDSMYNGNSDSGYTYYSNRADGFYGMAVDGMGSIFTLRKSKDNSQLRLLGNFGITRMDTAFVPDTALRFLKFPVTTNEEWFSYEYNTIPRSAIRKWIGYTTVTTPAGTFNCAKLQMTRTNSSGYVVYQYFSSKGLIMEEYQINNMVFSSGQISNYHFLAKLVSTNF